MATTIPKFTPKAMLQVVVDSMASGNDGEVIYTEMGNQYIVSNTGALIKTTDIMKVNSLPTSNQRMDKLYFLSTDKTIRMWNGVSWDGYGSPSYVLTPATNTNLGGVKSGGDVSIDSNGQITVNTGTGINNILRLDSTDKIPAVDGSQLTGLTKTQVGLSNVTNDAQVKRSEMGIASGIATLDASGKVPVSMIPISEVTITSVANQTARLALPKLTNLQLALQADTQGLWALNANVDPTVAGNWINCGTYSAQVSSVNGAVGAVTINATTVGLGNVTNNKQVKAIASSVDKDIVIFSGTTGDIVVDSGKTLPVGNILGDTDVQTVKSKDISDKSNKFGIISPSSNGTSAIVLTKADGSTSVATVDTTNGKFIVNTCFGLPSVTTTVRNSITGLIGGEMVYDNTLGMVMVYDGSIWYQQ